MSLTAIGLCSRALLKLGGRSISSFEEGSAEAEIAAAFYAPTRDALLSAHAWSFATTQATLPRLAETPLADYACAHQLPADFLRAVSAGVGGQSRGLSYRITGRALHSNSQVVFLTYLFRPLESDFPPFFNSVLIARLAAEFCLPLTENTSRADVLARLAEQELRRARLIDAQQDTQPGIEGFALIEARQ
jgi:hypothetical protein